MRLPIPDDLWTAFLTHLAQCPLGETQCPECQHLLHAWGDAEQLQARAQVEQDIAEGCWGLDLERAPMYEPQDLPDVGERSL